MQGARDDEPLVRDVRDGLEKVLAAPVLLWQDLDLTLFGFPEEDPLTRLVRPLRISIPIYESARRGPLLIRLGMILYDLLSVGKIRWLYGGYVQVVVGDDRRDLYTLKLRDDRWTVFRIEPAWR